MQSEGKVRDELQLELQCVSTIGVDDVIVAPRVF